ncbi:YegP family protein [Microlunatus sp. GCM10028923]|uniref:YegP family protein n=1 Tax=Microlunatus sp. GCM10028923 TaxID=3273400 RepID=UPI00361BE99E
MTATFDIYKDNRGKYRWRLAAADGEVLAGSDAQYDTLAAAITATKSAKRAAAGAKVADRT